MVTSRARLLGVFAAAAALTALELAALTLDLQRPARVTVLAGLAIAKGAVILWAFMHLGRQRRSLRAVVLTPIGLVAGLTTILMLDAVVRLGGGP